MISEAEKIVPEDPNNLWDEYKKTGCIEIRNRIVENYQSVVKITASKIISSYKYFSYLDDLVNEGIIALISSVERFDISKNVKFETYASIKIRGAMIDYIRKQDCFPRRVKSMAKKINEANSYLSNEYGRLPTNEELSQHLDISLDKFEKLQAETHSLNILSFEQTIEDQYTEHENIDPINSSNIITPEQHLADEELILTLQNCIDRLNEKEKMVISLYYKEQLKIKEIADVLEVSDSRVSQIHTAALRKLNSDMKKY